MIVSYFRSSGRGDVGATTEIGALTTYWIGVAAGAGAFVFAGALGIGLTVLLAAKQRLEASPTAAPALGSRVDTLLSRAFGGGDPVH